MKEFPFKSKTGSPSHVTMLIRVILLLSVSIYCCFGTDELIIRHGRSRVRHSTELRWGLKALDNLTLDYEDDGSNSTEANTTSLTDNNNGSFVELNDMATVSQKIMGKKKVRKKEIMKNIKKNVDKGLEYLRTHADAVDATMSLIDMRMKRGELQTTTSTEPSSGDAKKPPSSSSSSVDIKNIITQQHQKLLQQAKKHSNVTQNDTKSPPAAMSHKSKSNSQEAEEDYAERPNDEEFILTMTDVDLVEEDGTSSTYHLEEIDLENLDEVSRINRKSLMKGQDVVTTFLRIVESQHLLGANCTAGTALNLGEGVVDRYAQDRFRVEAEIAVNRANMLTR